MAKKIMAVTNIKIGQAPEDYFPAGSQLDATKFSKDQLVQLHDAGAITVEDSTSPEEIQAAVTETVPPPVVTTMEEPVSTTTSAKSPEEPKK